MHYIYSSNKQNNPPKIELYQKLAHHLWYTTYNSLCAQSHTPQRQARTVLKTSTDNHFSSCHSHQLLRWSKTRHYQHLVGVLFHVVGVRMTKGADHFGDCFVRVRPVNRLSSCKYRTFGQTFGLSTYFPSSLAFYFTVILTTRRSLCTLQLYHLQDGDRGLCFQHGGVATNGDVSARNRFLFPVKVNNCWNVQRWLERRCGRSARKKRIVL